MVGVGVVITNNFPTGVSSQTNGRCRVVLAQIETNKPGGPGPSEGVLANFFNSLLSKKTATNSPAPGTIKTNGEAQGGLGWQGAEVIKKK